MQFEFADEIVLIEVQTSIGNDYFYRMLFGASEIVANYLKKKELNYPIKNVYIINITYSDDLTGDDYIYHGAISFAGVNRKDQLHLTENQKFFYQKEPEYYLIKVNRFDDIVNDTLDEWVYFLKNQEIKDGFRAKGLLEAKEKLDFLKLSELEEQEHKKFL